MNSLARRLVWQIVGVAALASSAQMVEASAISGSSESFGASDMSLYSGSKLVLGDSASVLQLNVPSAGLLSLTWTDLDFSSSLAHLDVELSNGIQGMGSYQAGGNTTVDLSGPATLYVTIFAAAQGNMDVGLYHVSAMFMPAVAVVALPGLGIWGLGAAFLVIVALGRKKFAGAALTFEVPHTKL